jgi:hypothetical protein
MKCIGSSLFGVGVVCHYFPKWAKLDTAFSTYGLWLPFPNVKNMQFNVSAKITEKQLKTLQEEKIVSDLYIISVDNVQTLLPEEPNSSLHVSIGVCGQRIQCAK